LRLTIGFIHIFLVSIESMIPRKPTGLKLLILPLFLLIFSSINVSAQDAGKAIFQTRCASCHIMGKDFTGPDLKDVEGRWDGRDQLHVWIKDWEKAVAAGYKQAGLIVKAKPTAMQKFDGVLSDKEIDDVLDYIRDWTPVVVTGGPGEKPKESNDNAVIFGVISLILAIIALILMQVNSNLKKMSDDAEGIGRPDPVPFYKNKVYIAMFSILFFVVAGYYAVQAGIGLGRQKDYQPIQPIYYSHKVHAGINQINCLYCHGSAWESKTAGIPSVNVCMNCHKTITTYEKGPKLFDENGEEIDGTREIAKLHQAAGFDPKNSTAWDPSMAKSIEWIKIHNLPDHVYFNHSQHVKTGKVQCQSCHGEINEMDEVKQASELSMGWCINCHRETKVNFNYSDSTGNKFYSIYEKFHNDFRAGRMDSVTVKDIGGLECQKCHY